MSEIVEVVKDNPAEGLSDSFKNEAKKVHKRAVTLFNSIQRDMLALGESFREMKDKGLYNALGYRNFRAYIEAEFPMDSSTQILQAMRIVKELSSGSEPAVPKDDLRKMSKDNAEGLAKLKKRGVPITPELITQAKEMPIKDFEAKVVIPLAPDVAARRNAKQGVSDDSVPEVLIRKTLTFSSKTWADWNLALRVAEKVCADSDKSVTLEEKMVQAALAEFFSQHHAEYQELLDAEEAEGLHTAQTYDASLPKEPANEPLNVTPVEDTGHQGEAFAEAATEDFQDPHAVVADEYVQDGADAADVIAEG